MFVRSTSGHQRGVVMFDEPQSKETLELCFPCSRTRGYKPWQFLQHVGKHRSTGQQQQSYPRRKPTQAHPSSSESCFVFYSGIQKIRKISSCKQMNWGGTEKRGGGNLGWQICCKQIKWLNEWSKTNLFMRRFKHRNTNFIFQLCLLQFFVSIASIIISFSLTGAFMSFPFHSNAYVW